jgi:hypothetical protein
MPFTMLLNLGNLTFDGDLIYSPTVLQPSFTMKGEFSLIQKELPSPQFEASEKNGLNLVVTVPEGTTSTSKLPVFVW